MLLRWEWKKLANEIKVVPSCTKYSIKVDLCSLVLVHMKEKPILFTTYVYLPTIIYNLSMYHYLITIHTWNYLEHGLKFDRRVNIYTPSINLRYYLGALKMWFQVILFISVQRTRKPLSMKHVNFPFIIKILMEIT